MRYAYLLFVLTSVLFLGCVSFSPSASPGLADQELVGNWRIFSETIFYNNGLSETIKPVSRVLELNSDGTWKFGTSSGTWNTDTIQSSDWDKWQIQSYGPTKKITLNGWDTTIASGPIEESSQVNFFWVIYTVNPPVVESPAQVQIKFGRTSG